MDRAGCNFIRCISYDNYSNKMEVKIIYLNKSDFCDYGAFNFLIIYLIISISISISIFDSILISV